MKRTILIYIAVLVFCGVGMFVAFERGRHLPPPAIAQNPPDRVGPTGPVAPGKSSIASPAVGEGRAALVGRLLLQVVVVVIATRVVGAIFAWCGQPSVVGEVLAGILLGPSLLGWVWPAASHFIFPPHSLAPLRLFSQVGVCLFMFVVGLELDAVHLRQKAQTAVVVSHASITIPYTMGVVMALFLYSTQAAPGTSFPAFALFMGIAMSITAFPVLARILKDRGITRTFLGTMAITCAAVDDATAWAILAFVVAIARTTSLASTALNLGLVLVFVALMLLLVRPLLARWLGRVRLDNQASWTRAIAVVLLLLVASAMATEWMGIHALFGAFLAGVVIPKQKELHEFLVLRLGRFSSLFLLPLFFAFSGLRTEVGLLSDPAAWLTCGAIIGIATLGKLGGTMVTARLMGMNWNESFALGALMNTRGLVELIALNIGYDLGILPPRMFAMMVLMALVTTFLTGPLLTLAERVKRRTTAAVAAA